MFIAYSRENKNNQYVLTHPKDACSTCGTHKTLILNQEITIWKLFWIIPIFRWTSYSLHCPKCGRYKVVFSKEGKALMELSLSQQYQSKQKASTQVFDEYNSSTQALTSPALEVEEKDSLTEAEKKLPEIENIPPNNTMEKLGEKIYHLRRSLYMSQEQFGDKIGVSRQTICKWELDKAQPDKKHIENMLTQLSLPLDYFETKEEKTIAPTKIEDSVVKNTHYVATSPHDTSTPASFPKKGSPLLNGLAITFGLALLIFNTVITIIHQAGFIQFPIFWFYIASFITANAMLIPVAICSIAKRKIAASLLSFISYVLIAIFTLGGAIPTYEKPETRRIYFHENILITLTSPFSYDDFWSSGENTLLFQNNGTYHFLLKFQWEEGSYNKQRDTSIILYGVDYDKQEHIIEQGYLLDPNTLAYDFAIDFNQYPSYKLRFSNEGITRFRVSWEWDTEKCSSPGMG